jgi:ketosteroid isomerase-like protein
MSQQNVLAARGLYDAFNRCDVEKLLDAGDSVVATGRYRGRHKATGKQLGAQFCHISHFDQQAKLDAIQEYTDTLLEAEVAGQVQRIAELRIPQPIM